MFENIPSELKQHPQWIVWRYEDLDGPKPTKVPYNPRSGRRANPNDFNTWGTFEAALLAFQSGGLYSGIGFVLSEKDPYCFIDLDETDNKAFFENQKKIVSEFDSYTEFSPSKKGLHIIIKGAVPCGRRRNQVEVYSSSRYMTMTGDTYKNTTINEHNEKVNLLWGLMEVENKAAQIYNGCAEEKDDDNTVYSYALNAKNGQKFLDLWNGQWGQYYISQSEADLALVDILAFYTQNVEQIKRMFRASALGKRKKADRDKYIEYMTNKCFDNMLPPVDLDGLQNQLNKVLEERAKNQVLKSQQTEIKSTEKPTEKEIEIESDLYTLPPGLLGDIAKYIYAQAPRPVAEIALTSAIALMSGITGRAYNVSGLGLNQYLLVLANTGTGKDAASNGIEKLINHVQKTVPAAVDFIGPAEIASPQAIIKYMSRGPNSFVSVMGEFGIQMQQMCNPNAPPHLLGLRRFLLYAYTKSGQGNILRPSIYSDKEKNTESLEAPAFTLFGESTPERFYEGLHEGLIHEGLLPRFTIVEYKGLRPALNETAFTVQPSKDLIERLSTLCAHCLMLNSQNKTIAVEFDENAKSLFSNLNKYCDTRINNGTNEVMRQLWSRVHVKSMKLASIAAVGINPLDPIIDSNIATWATNIIVKDCENFIERFECGEIGIDNDENKQLIKTIEVVRDYILKPWHDVETYAKGFGILHQNRIVPYTYIQRKLVAIAVFRKDRQGSTQAIKRTINTLIERGDLQEISKPAMAKDFKLSCRAFMISNVKAFDLEILK